MRVITQDDALIGGRAAAAVTLRPADVTPCSAWATSLIFFMVIRYFLHFHHHIAILIISIFIDSSYSSYLLHVHYHYHCLPRYVNMLSIFTCTTDLKIILTLIIISVIFLTFILIHLYSHFRHLTHFRPILAIFSLITIPSVAVPSNTFPTSSSAVVFPFITIFTTVILGHFRHHICDPLITTVNFNRVYSHYIFLYSACIKIQT